MLGLSLHTLAVPDYELVTRLEQLILANQANVSAAVALESALVSSDLGDGFQAGYSHAGRLLAGSRVRGGSTVVPPAGVTSAVQRHKVEAGLGWTNTQPVVIRNRLTSVQWSVTVHYFTLSLESSTYFSINLIPVSESLTCLFIHLSHPLPLLFHLSSKPVFFTMLSTVAFLLPAALTSWTIIWTISSELCWFSFLVLFIFFSCMRQIKLATCQLWDACDIVSYYNVRSAPSIHSPHSIYILYWMFSDVTSGAFLRYPWKCFISVTEIQRPWKYMKSPRVLSCSPWK